MEKTHLLQELMTGLKKAGADDIILSLTEETRQQIKFFNNKITDVKNWQSTDIGLFLTENKKILLSSVNGLSKKNMQRTIKDALKFVRVLGKNEEYNGIAKGPFKYKDVKRGYDKKVASLEEGAIDIVSNSIDLALENNVKRCAGVFENGNHKTFLLTSNEIKGEDKGSEAYFSMRVFTDKDASGHAVCTSRTLDGMDIEYAVKRASQHAVDSKKPRSIQPGRFDIIFDPLPFANILQNVGGAASVYSVETGFSYLKDKQGKKVAHKSIFMYDDGRIENGINSSKFDEEGVPTKKTPLIEGGILKGYLHNTTTAKRYKTKSTGNAGVLAPDPTNVVLKNGDKSIQELIEGTKEGIYVSNIWYTRFQNYLTGDFSTIPRDGAFYIKNGKIMHPLKNFRLGDNLMRLMQNINGLGKRTEQIRGWEVETPVFCPPALIKGMKVTKPESKTPKSL